MTPTPTAPSAFAVPQVRRPAAPTALRATGRPLAASLPAGFAPARDRQSGPTGDRTTGEGS
ncbi:hypothetical protein [Streptomyces sp. NPDC006463]|uniref:hypothetical protein n=1 Tax=Streptomyces sp. NPDC006463 TaxID=3364746 RepID=UPI00368E9D64